MFLSHFLLNWMLFLNTICAFLFLYYQVFCTHFLPVHSSLNSVKLSSSSNLLHQTLACSSFFLHNNLEVLDSCSSEVSLNLFSLVESQDLPWRCQQVRPQEPYRFSPFVRFHFIDCDIRDDFLSDLWQQQVLWYFKNDIGRDAHGDFYGYMPLPDEMNSASILTEVTSCSREREEVYFQPFSDNQEGFYIRYIRPKECSEVKTVPDISDIQPLNAQRGSPMYPKGFFDSQCFFDHGIFRKQSILWTFSVPGCQGSLLAVRNARPASVAGGFLIFYTPEVVTGDETLSSSFHIPHLTQRFDSREYRKDILKLVVSLSQHLPYRHYICFSSYGGNCSNAHFHFRLESLNASQSHYFEGYRGLGNFNFNIRCVCLVDEVDALLEKVTLENLSFNMGVYRNVLSVSVRRPDRFNPSFSGYNKGFGSLENMFNVHALYDRETFNQLLALPSYEVVRLLTKKIRQELSIEQNRVKRYIRELNLSNSLLFVGQYSRLEPEIQSESLLNQALALEKLHPTSTTNYFKPLPVSLAVSQALTSS